MGDWPRTYRPLDDDPAAGDLVELFQHQPGRTADLVAWSGGTELAVNGAPAVLLPGDAAVPDRVVGLGDYAARHPDGSHRLERADCLHQRYDTAPANPPTRPAAAPYRATP